MTDYDTKAFRDAIRAEADISLDEWSDNYRYLPTKSSPEPGRYRTERTPYLKEIMQCLSVNSMVSDICVMKGTQLGFTEIGNNFFFYVVDVAPGPFMMVLPTDSLAKGHSKQKLTPSIQETPRIRFKIRANEKQKESGNTILEKEFKGGILFMSGSNSPANYRNKTIRYLFLDDIDGFEADVGGEGDPAELARRRTDTFSYRKKILQGSTPTVKGVSRIEMEFEESDQRYYHVPCPNCKELQVLEWGGKDADHGIRFMRDDKGKAIDAWYQCKFCGSRIDESEKTWMLINGQWIPEHPDREKRGYHLSGLYSPLGWVSWLDIAKEFLDARNNRPRQKVWTNTRLAKTWEEKGETVEWIQLKTRAEPYQVLTVPLGCKLLSSGVDTQDNRLVVSVWGWGSGDESWLITHHELYGDPINDEVWSKLDEILYRGYTGESGDLYHVISTAIDSGGHRTQAVYNYCRSRSPNVFAIQGASKPDKPVISSTPSIQDLDYKGTRVKGGVQLWTVGTDSAKAMIYPRLKIDEPGANYVHFPIGLPDEYFMQLTAEKLITQIDKNGRSKLVWVKIRERNEGLDCYVYAYAAAIRAGLNYAGWNQPGGLIVPPGGMAPGGNGVKKRGVRSRGI